MVYDGGSKRQRNNLGKRFDQVWQDCRLFKETLDSLPRQDEDQIAALTLAGIRLQKIMAQLQSIEAELGLR